jgi:hypothetical protein
MDHWERLKAAIDARGLSALIAETGQDAGQRLISGMADGPSIDNFEPLMEAHNAIVSNAMTFVEDRYCQSPLLIMGGDPEAPDCPICCLNWLHLEHDKHCTKPNCDYPKAATYDWMIDRAADDALEAWKALGAA